MTSDENRWVTREQTAEEVQMERDYDWAVNDPDVRQKYRGQIVAVYKGVVLGAGKHHGEALAAARSHAQYPHECDDWVLTVPIVANELPYINPATDDLD